MKIFKKLKTNGIILFFKKIFPVEFLNRSCCDSQQNAGINEVRVIHLYDDMVSKAEILLFAIYHSIFSVSL
ncbi:MAG: hypothetical protein A2043_10355 [Candidatus Schekmanbacteria bacterium GWA2_38_9]|uniref:Uncharacterized protein n=1 Tax=Candidatus Schekmanbacteria bacterium RIFCSPLOWO2_12_FULL_38_15 TaxID=1817883 RepID=A0A1F7SEG5_9BACT|nr:MAG: hypothetical protein A2043_10355 [Candidatus Schekmanbacteria bacterium GWA2_38_9]OGL49464.1 MAG: hypothetical protein A3H37_10175 [Candidatus Schekmanbacteria bacterium RIFCSPLOWO2_02_FULL_38_14]OGL52172.1 MAG: hypothetical protein A3G31_07075 [Candidatus Schekmanbacteria bacterium RIFCSPLOWO2_12_FULL_38_15]